MKEKPILVFQTDFTYKEGAVCAMYGVVKSVDRTLEIIDATHELPQYDIWSASYRLYQSMVFWPKGTVFVSVVDPGVGTERKACVAKTKNGYYIVTPDNGTLTHVKAHFGIEEIRVINEKVNRLQSTAGVSVFHGRDLFGYCAARLASGIINFEETGHTYSADEIVSLPILEPEIFQGKAVGIFEINDPNFGNLWTNIGLSSFIDAGFTYGSKPLVTIKHKGEVVFKEKVLFEKSFGYAEKGDVMIYNNELMRVAMAVNQGNLCKEYRLSHGSDWVAEFEMSDS